MSTTSSQPKAKSKKASTAGATKRSRSTGQKPKRDRTGKVKKASTSRSGSKASSGRSRSGAKGGAASGRSRSKPKEGSSRRRDPSTTKKKEKATAAGSGNGGGGDQPEVPKPKVKEVVALDMEERKNEEDQKAKRQEQRARNKAIREENKKNGIKPDDKKAKKPPTHPADQPTMRNVPMRNLIRGAMKLFTEEFGVGPKSKKTSEKSKSKDSNVMRITSSALLLERRLIEKRLVLLLKIALKNMFTAKRITISGNDVKEALTLLRANPDMTVLEKSVEQELAKCNWDSLDPKKSKVAREQKKKVKEAEKQANGGVAIRSRGFKKKKPAAAAVAGGAGGGAPAVPAPTPIPVGA